MKKTILIFSIIFTGLKTFSQTLLNLNNLVNITLPVGSTSILHEDALSIAKNIFYKDPSASILLKNAYTDVYKIGDVLFRFYTNNRPVKAGFLQSLKTGRDKVLTVASGYTSNIINVNGKDILVTKFTGAPVYDYSFICYNATNTAMISGFVIFNKEDGIQAKLVLDAILAGIKFTGE